jgi:hypothetical protein
LLWLAGAVVAAPLLLAWPARADAKPAPETSNSTALVPADVSYYSALLRNKQQLDIVRKSKAYQRLKELPIVKEKLAELSKEDGPLGKLRAFLEMKDNKELADVLTDAAANEVFCYAGSSWPELIGLSAEVFSAVLNGVAAGVLGGEDPGKAAGRAVLQLLDKNKGKVKAPQLVFGFKVSDARKVEGQITRLERVLQAFIKNKEELEFLKGKLQRVRVDGSNFLALTLDGGMLPWDQVPIKDWEDRGGEFDEIIKHLKETTLTVSLGVRDNYLLFALSSKAEDLATFGTKGKKLSGRAELKPLAKAGKKPLTAISYVSKALKDKLFGTPADIDSLVKMGKVWLSKAELPEGKQKAIEKDLDGLAADIKKYLPVRGASFTYEYLTDSGYEGFSYDYGKHDSYKGAHFKLRDHLGGDPIFAMGYGRKVDGTLYATAVKWIKTIYGHAEEQILARLGDDEKDKYKKGAKAIFPLFKRFDEATRNLLLPALKDGSLAVVLDGKWTSKKWFPDIPAGDKAMPMLQPGLVLSLADAGKFQKAMKEYRITLNELFEKAGEVDKENVPEVKIPVPDSAKVAGGTLYYYKLPEDWGVDKQIQPTAGVGKAVAALTLSRAHTERLLARKPLVAKTGPLARKDVIGMTYFNVPALIDAIGPWVELSIAQSVPVPDDKDAAREAKQKAEAIIKQVRVVLDVLKVWQTYSSATYLEDGVLATHYQYTFKDRE